ncbi:alanine racemase [Sphingomonas sp. AX6]|uniref:alanine racemase n=1 Tax=Sphingomonas sp. AX6 TaxID=2653171 RepID=UPI001915CC86
MPPAPLRLRLDGDALVANWRMLDHASGAAACGAAVKADGYGLGARGVVTRLSEAGCRDFFVSNWAEAKAIADLGVTVSVLHGVRSEDMGLAKSGIARPVLNTARQVQRWREAGGGICDVMVDTGMNRLGLSIEEARSGLLDGLEIQTLMSHLACADEVHPLNRLQLNRFALVKERVNACRYSLANSAGVLLGRDYAFDLTRPGLALYGGVPSPAAEERVRQVVFPEAQVIQRRRLHAGDVVGYNATWSAVEDTELAVLNIGYADGYLRGFSGVGCARSGDNVFPVRGRVSMDLLIVDVGTTSAVAEGDWLRVEYSLYDSALRSGVSQYELLTGLGKRFSRMWQ